MKIITTILCALVLAGAAYADPVADSLAASGALLAAQGKTEQAKDVLYRALACDENCGKALFELAKIYEKEGSSDTAGSLYLSAAKVLNGSQRDIALSKAKSASKYMTRFLEINEEYVRSLDALGSRFDNHAISIEIGLRVKNITGYEEWIKRESTRWITIYRSDNTSVVDSRPIPDDISFVKVERADSGECVIVKLSKQDLYRNVILGQYGWWGLKNVAFGSRHIGIYDTKMEAHKSGDTIISMETNKNYSGWGFGHIAGDDRGAVIWNGAEIKNTVVKISVTTGRLSWMDQSKLVSEFDK